MTAQNQPITVTIDAACQLLSVGRTTIYEQIKSGRLPVVKMGRRTLIRRSDIEALIEGPSAGEKPWQVA